LRPWILLTEGDSIGAQTILKKCEKHVNGIQPGRKIPPLQEETDEKKGKSDIAKSRCSVDSLGNLIE